MRNVPITLGVALVGMVALTLQPAGAQPGDSRIVDRTLVCAMGISGGIRKIELTGRTGTRDFTDPATWKVRAGAEVANPYGGQLDTLATVAAGAPPPGGLSFVPNPARCKQTKARVSLSTKGLTGGTASPTGDEYECRVPDKLLVRIRALFRDPTSLRKIWADPLHTYRLTVADGEIREGYLMARTESGKPVAYAAVFESGKARLLTAKGCVAS